MYKDVGKEEPNKVVVKHYPTSDVLAKVPGVEVRLHIPDDGYGRYLFNNSGIRILLTNDTNLTPTDCRMLSVILSQAAHELEKVRAYGKKNT